MTPTDILTIAQYAHKKRPDLFGDYMFFFSGQYRVETNFSHRPFNPLTNDTDFRMLLEAFANKINHYISEKHRGEDGFISWDDMFAGQGNVVLFWSTITKESFCNKLLEMAKQERNDE